MADLVAKDLYYAFIYLACFGFVLVLTFCWCVFDNFLRPAHSTRFVFSVVILETCESVVCWKSCHCDMALVTHLVGSFVYPAYMSFFTLCNFFNIEVSQACVTKAEWQILWYYCPRSVCRVVSLISLISVLFIGSSVSRKVPFAEECYKYLALNHHFCSPDFVFNALYCVLVVKCVCVF